MDENPQRSVAAIVWRGSRGHAVVPALAILLVIWRGDALPVGASIGILAGAFVGALGATLGLVARARDAHESRHTAAALGVWRQSMAFVLMGVLVLGAVGILGADGRLVALGRVVAIAIVSVATVGAVSSWLRAALRADGVEREIAIRAAAATLPVTLGALGAYALAQTVANVSAIVPLAVVWTTWWLSVGYQSRRMR